jgi:hypothetical protein
MSIDDTIYDLRDSLKDSKHKKDFDSVVKYIAMIESESGIKQVQKMISQQASNAVDNKTQADKNNALLSASYHDGVLHGLSLTDRMLNDLKIVLR